MNASNTTKQNSVVRQLWCRHGAGLLWKHRLECESCFIRVGVLHTLWSHFEKSCERHSRRFVILPASCSRHFKALLLRVGFKSKHHHKSNQYYSVNNTYCKLTHHMQSSNKNKLKPRHAMVRHRMCTNFGLSSNLRTSFRARTFPFAAAQELRWLWTRWGKLN